MKKTEVMKQLKAMGTAQNRKVYARHGAGKEMYGVSYANLGKLRKQIKVDHDLACDLWATGNVDARALAAMVADPQAFRASDLDAWLRDLEYHGLVDALASVAAASPHGPRKADKWRKARNEYAARAGWVVLGNLALSDPDLPDHHFAEALKEIEAGVHEAKNRAREGMHHALIQIGCRSKGLRRKALAAAKRIGKVVIDHGETGCKTPDAGAYIEKTWAHAESKGFPSPAAQEQARNRRSIACAR